jgi:hypothetical protein
MRRTLLAAAALVLALTSAGCGADEGDGSQVASGGGTQDPSAASSAPANLSQEEMGVKFAQCMRENGVNMDDPEPGGGIRLKLDGKVPRETVDKAMEACRQYNPQAQSSPGSDPQAEERVRKFAECMRENGVEAFPDPKPGQRGIMLDRKMEQDPDFKTAQQACQNLVSGGPQG